MNSSTWSFVSRGVSVLGTGLAVTLIACSSNTGASSDAGSDGAPAASSCAMPGGAVTGAQDMHCGSMKQLTTVAGCTADAAAAGDDGGSTGDDGGAADAGDIGNCGNPDFGATMYNSSGSDDDCKYDVHWTSTPICEGQPGVYFTVTATKRIDGSPLTGANARPDAVLDCTHSILNHPANPSPEISPGTYLVGPIVFDKPGRWVFRFHFHEECADFSPESPHGHAAFYIQVP